MKKPRLNKEEFIEELAKTKNGDIYTLTGEYKNMCVSTEFYCKKHNIYFKTQPRYILQGACSCPKCKGEKAGNSTRKKNEKFLEELKEKNIEYEPQEEYKGAYTKIKFKCKNGHEFFATPHNILKGFGCPYCVNRAIIEEENSLWATRPDLRKFVPKESEKIAKSKSAGSVAKIELICPDCGKRRKMIIEDFSAKGFICNFCRSTISFPNRFLRLFLLKFKNYIKDLEFEYQIRYNDTYYRYDASFYFNNKHYLIEMDGDFHDFDENTQNRDKIKNQYAKENNCILVRIGSPTVKERRDIIKNNILNSELSKIFDLNSIDWEQIFIEAEKTNELKDFVNFIKLNKGKLSRAEIREIFDIDKEILKNKIDKAIETNLIEKDDIIDSRKIKGENFIIAYKEDKELGVFRSLNEFAGYIQKNFELNKTINGIKKYFYKDKYKSKYPYKSISKEKYYEILFKSLIIPENNLFVICYLKKRGETV